MSDINALVGVVIFIFVLIALAPQVIELSDTSAGSPLENASSGAKAIYSLIPLMYAILGLGAILVVLRFKKGK